MNLAGLLAWFTVEHLPAAFEAPQWYEDSTVECEQRIVGNYILPTTQ